MNIQDGSLQTGNADISAAKLASNAILTTVRAFWIQLSSGTSGNDAYQIVRNRQLKFQDGVIQIRIACILACKLSNNAIPTALTMFSGFGCRSKPMTIM